MNIILRRTRATGIEVSKRQVMRLLIADQGGFIAEARDVLRSNQIEPPGFVRKIGNSSRIELAKLSANSGFQNKTLKSVLYIKNALRAYASFQEKFFSNIH